MHCFEHLSQLHYFFSDLLKDTTGKTFFKGKQCSFKRNSYFQDAANEHRESLRSLDALLRQIAENPEPVGEDFEFKLKRLQVRVKTVLADARISSSSSQVGNIQQ